MGCLFGGALRDIRVMELCSSKRRCVQDEDDLSAKNQAEGKGSWLQGQDEDCRRKKGFSCQKEKRKKTKNSQGKIWHWTKDKASLGVIFLSDKAGALAPKCYLYELSFYKLCKTRHVSETTLLSVKFNDATLIKHVWQAKK